MTLELLHVIRDYTLTRTLIPNHAGNTVTVYMYDNELIYK